jgi:hypothetical protein
MWDGIKESNIWIFSCLIADKLRENVLGLEVNCDANNGPGLDSAKDQSKYKNE